MFSAFYFIILFFFLRRIVDALIGILIMHCHHTWQYLKPPVYVAACEMNPVFMQAHTDMMKNLLRALINA